MPLVFAVTIPLSIRYRSVALPREQLKRTRYDIPLRAAAVALVVAAVTTASHWIGSLVSGMFAVFPIVMGSFVAIMHPRVGGTAAAAVLSHAQPMLSASASASSASTISPSRSACGGPMPPASPSRCPGAACSGWCGGRSFDRFEFWAVSALGHLSIESLRSRITLAHFRVSPLM